MIHLGEDRYIDTSLITCAEYEVFLKERGGSSHRPDHWETTSFPKGAGRTPVLGVRSSDALAFCVWLTEFDRSITWQYRLPTRGEQELLEAKKALTTFSQESLGYWIENGRGFAWIKDLPPSIEPIVTMTQEVFHRNQVEVPPTTLSRACNRTKALDLERTWTRFSDIKIGSVVDPALSHADALTVARYFNHARARWMVANLTSERDAIPTLVITLKQEVNSILTRTYYGNIESILDLSCKLIDIFIRIRELSITAHEALIHAYECCLDLIISLVLLNARLRSEQPAREGILLARSRRSLIPA